jgi:solute carrier family 44 (choline transporter-like protein), member 2/4/5
MPRKQESAVDDDSHGKSEQRKSRRKRSGSINYHELTTPSNKHGCTDIICTIIFLIFIIAFVGLSIFSYVNGSPSNLILPRDSYGSMCGEGIQKDKKFLLYFDLVKCLRVSAAITGCSTPQVCVEACPDRNLYDQIPGQNKTLNKYCYTDRYSNVQVCPNYVLESKPIFGRCIPDILATTADTVPDFFLTVVNDQNENVAIEIQNDNGTSSQLNFKLLKNASNYLKDLLNLKRSFEYAYEDFENSAWLILTALAIAMITSFIFILLLRCFVKPFVYLSILGVLGVLVFGLYFCVDYYLFLKKSDPVNSVDNSDYSFEFERFLDLNYIKSLKETWLALSIIIGVVILILVLILIFLRKRIKFAIELIKEASRTIGSVPSTLIWPIIPFLLKVGLFAFCIATAVFLASSGIPLFKIVEKNSSAVVGPSDVKFNVGDYCNPKDFYDNQNNTNSNYGCYFYTYGYNTTFKNYFNRSNEQISLAYLKSVEFLNDNQWLPQLYVAFMFFWFSAFVVGLSQMTLAGTFGIWYWSRFSNANKNRKNNLPFLPIFRSFFRAIFYHFGSIAFGSLLIAIIKLIRLILSYIDKKVKEAGPNNKCAKFLSTCCLCCFWCLEKFIKFINHNAYIVTGVYGYNFCKAAATAFKIIVSNCLRVAVVDRLTNFLLFLTKLAITAGITVLSFYFFTKRIPIESLTAFSPDLHYYFLPIFVIAIGTFIIAKVFFDVFALCVDTLLLSCLIDAEVNDGTSEKPYFMSKGLKKILGLKNKE